MIAPFVPVTGPDGDNPITDEQLRELMAWARERGHMHLTSLCTTALTDRRAMAFQMPGVAEGVREARARCAAAYNARWNAMITAEQACPICTAAPGTACLFDAFERLGADGQIRDRRGDVHAARAAACNARHGAKL